AYTGQNKRAVVAGSGTGSRWNPLHPWEGAVRKAGWDRRQKPFEWVNPVCGWRSGSRCPAKGGPQWTGPFLPYLEGGRLMLSKNLSLLGSLYKCLSSLLSIAKQESLFGGEAA